MTEKVTLVVVFFSPVLLIVQMPLLLVTQLAVPLAPLDHLATTVALATALSATSCTRIVTMAFQLLPAEMDERSRSPMCSLITGTGVGVGEGGG